jgi:hypothetical protein
MAELLLPDPDDDDFGFGFDLSPLFELSPEAEENVRQAVEAMRTPLARGDPRRHHYVPKFFLKRFADGDQIARVLAEKPRDHRVLGVNDVAVVKDLYTTIDIEVGETVAVERILAIIDAEASSAIERLAYGLLFPPTRLDRVNIATWLSMLHQRIPRTRRQMEALADQTFKMQLSLVHDETSARAFLRGDGDTDPDDEMVQELLDTVADMDEWEIAPHQNVHVENMLRFGMEATPFFLGRYWTVIKYPEKGLVLSDDPIVVYQRPENRSSLRGVGIGNADELWIPLDRSTALVLHSEKDVGDRVIKAPSGHTVDDFNQNVVGSAYREVYCHPDDVQRLRRLKFPKTNVPLMTTSGAEWIKGRTDGVNAPPVRVGHRRYRRSD